MTGWAGAVSNRTWQRDRRTARSSLEDDVRRILEEWRERHGWTPGAVWNPRTGTYENG